MTEYPNGSAEDRASLSRLPAGELLEHLFLQIRNTWRVDGLYFLGIEKSFGTEAATQIDAEVWSDMATIEAKALGLMSGLAEKPSTRAIVELLGKSSWALDQPFKTVVSDDGDTILSIDRCRTQEARLRKGLGEFPCKQVRLGYLEKFAKALNPDVEVNCLFCPPDRHPQSAWCRWEFKLPKTGR